MTSRLDRLLEAIHPARTIEEAQRCADQAINSFPMDRVRIADFTEFQEFVEKVYRHVEASVLRMSGGMPPRDFAFSWGQCVPTLNEAFGCSEGWKPAFEMARTGNEGGLRAVVNKIAEAITRRYAKEWIAGQIWNYWNGLSVAEQLAAPDEYLRRFGHLLPSELTEAGAGRLRANFPKVLQEHPRLLERLRTVGR